MAEALRDAAFRAVVEEAPDAILLVDATGRITYLNVHAEELFGYARAELLGQRVEMLVPESKRSMHVIHREVYQEGPERRPMGAGLDLVGQCKDGSTFPVEISLSPLRGVEAPFSVAVVRDVTRQRRAEETLRRSEERHRLLNERAESVIFRYRLQPHPGFEYISAAVRARLGYAPEEFYVDEGLIGRITHTDDQHVIVQALSPSAPRAASLRLTTREGITRWFEFSVTPVRLPDGAVTALEGIARDITDRRIADEERLRLQSEIEMQLERSRIAGDLHDDTIQSIYALGLGLQVARDDESISKQDGIDRAIEELNRVIASLREYMHQLSGDHDEPAENEPLDTRLRALVPTSGTPAWRLEVDADLELAPATERELFLLAKELVSNVQRHSQADHASLALQRDEEGRLEFEVNDDGVGFEREGVDSGSFGLRSVELRANSLGAMLEIDTRPGTGTRIRVCVPSFRSSTHAPSE
jgi:PAS domain S-box-containing protein